MLYWVSMHVLRVSSFSPSVHYNSRISYLLGSVRSSSYIELLSHVLGITRLLLGPMRSLLHVVRISLGCTHRLPLISRLSKSNYRNVYFRIVYYKVVVVVIRDDVCYNFRLPISLARPLLMLVSLWLISSIFLCLGCLSLSFTLSVSMGTTNSLLLLAAIRTWVRALEYDFWSLNLLSF